VISVRLKAARQNLITHPAVIYWLLTKQRKYSTKGIKIIFCKINELIKLELLKKPTVYRAVIAQSVQRWATGWTIGILGFDYRRGLGIFLFTTASRTALGLTQPPIQWVPGALSLRGEAAGA
jgi:hypothetical protein